MTVSVKRFVIDEPGLFKATAGFVDLFAKVPDPVLQVARKCSSVNGKIAWTLLGTALFQDCSFSQISALLNLLFEKFPEDKLWTLPVPKDSEIEDCVKTAMNGCCWSVSEHASGIFWSVGHFVRRHENLEGWLNSRSPREVWRDLGEIYFMGKGNPRPKACAAIYRMISPAPVGLGLQTRPADPQNPADSKMPSLPLTMGARRFLSILGPGKDEKFAELSPATKQKMANEFYVALASAQSKPAQSQPAQSRHPYVAAHALQFFLEDGKDGFICRVATDHCKKCPLYEYCGYAERHDR